MVINYALSLKDQSHQYFTIQPEVPSMFNSIDKQNPTKLYREMPLKVGISKNGIHDPMNCKDQGMECIFDDIMQNIQNLFYWQLDHYQLHAWNGGK